MSLQPADGNSGIKSTDGNSTPATAKPSLQATLNVSPGSDLKVTVDKTVLPPPSLDAARSAATTSPKPPPKPTRPPPKMVGTQATNTSSSVREDLIKKFPELGVDPKDPKNQGEKGIYSKLLELTNYNSKDLTESQCKMVKELAEDQIVKLRALMSQKVTDSTPLFQKALHQELSDQELYSLHFEIEQIREEGMNNRSKKNQYQGFADEAKFDAGYAAIKAQNRYHSPQKMINMERAAEDSLKRDKKLKSEFEKGVKEVLNGNKTTVTITYRPEDQMTLIWDLSKKQPNLEFRTQANPNGQNEITISKFKTEVRANPAPSGATKAQGAAAKGVSPRKTQEDSAREYLSEFKISTKNTGLALKQELLEKINGYYKNELFNGGGNLTKKVDLYNRGYSIYMGWKE